MRKLFYLVQVLLFSSCIGFGQNYFQPRAISQNGIISRVIVNEDLDNIILRQKPLNSNIIDVQTPIWNYTVLSNNPIPWYLRDDRLYYISFDTKFKGFYDLRIHTIDMLKLVSNEIVSRTDIKSLDSDPLDIYFLSRLHNRGFFKEDFEELFYDFTVTRKKQIILASYYKEELCMYESVEGKLTLEFCGCSSVKLFPPFQLFVRDNSLSVIDKAENVFKVFETEQNNFNVEKLFFATPKTNRNELLIQN